MVRAQYRAPSSSSFLHSRRFSKKPCYSLTADFRETLLADVSGILTIRKVINHGNPRWCGSSLVDGKRSQRFFRTKEDAQTWVTNLRNDPTEQFWRSLSHCERQMIMISYRSSHPPARSIKAVKIKEAVSQYLKLKERQSLREPSLVQIRRFLTMLASEYGSLYCYQINASMIEEWFQSRNWKRSTIDGVIAKIGPFFSWCIREKMVTNSPLNDLHLPKQDQVEPCILTPDEVRRLLSASHRQDSALLPYLALGIFAGIRPHEIMRLSWKDINEQGILLKGHNAKSRQRRLVSISDNLKEWLLLGGDIPPNNKRKRLEAIREAAMVNWGHDIMRHTFASYHLAHYCSPDKTAHELGHRDTKMLYRHYRRVVSRNCASEFWSIQPQ